jgi:ADP-heptose:LPS heptosyltransferase
MKTVLISPYSRKLRNGGVNPKDYPYWAELVSMMRIDGWIVTQIGTNGEKQIEGVNEFLTNLSLGDLEDKIGACDTWISVDNFIQHFAWYHGKKGIVIFGQSDPLVFGHNTNINVLKNRSYLRQFQFAPWEDCKVKDDAFVQPVVVMEHLTSIV